MRVSPISFYRQPNFKSSRIVKATNESKEVPTVRPIETEDFENIGVRPAIIKTFWRKPELKPLEKHNDYNANLSKLNSYIVNTSAHENFDGYPITYNDLCKNYGDMHTVIHHYQKPRELVQYYADYFNEVLRSEPNGNETTDHIIANLDYKIDFDMLGMSESDLNLRDKARFAALFDFWSVTLEGKPRNGFERPAFVRSPEEYLDILSKDDKRYDSIIFEANLLLGFRFTEEEKNADNELQKVLDAEYEQMVKDRKKLPFGDRGAKPVTLRSPINRSRALVRHRLQRMNKEQEKIEAMIKDSEDMQKLWYDFIGGYYD